jgi:hypothetical protein
MQDALKEMLVSAALRDELRHKGLERSKEFSLEKMVENTCRVYCKL